MATSINSYSVSLAMDASSYIRNSKLSRKETASLTRDINSARSPAEKYERSVNRLDKALKAGALSQGTYNRLLDEQKRKLSGAAKQTSSLTTTVRNLGLAYAAMKLAATAGFASKLAADAESTAVAFRVLIGDADLAQRTLMDLNAFAARTPFQQTEIQNAGKMLLAFNFATHELNKELTILGNLAAGTNQPIGELAEMIGKARVQTTIFSEDLNQFTGRGINVLDGLAKRFGVTTDKVKKLASESKISFTDIQAVLEELALGAGKFNGLMEEQSETVNGKLSTAWDNATGIMRGYGVELNKVLVAGDKATGAGGFLKWMNDLISTPAPKDRYAGLNAATTFEEINVEIRKLKAERASRPGLLSPRDFLNQIAPKQKTFPPLEIKGVDSAMSSGLNSLGNSIMGGFNSVGGIFAKVGDAIAIANHNAAAMVVEAQKESPAIKSLEVGTQEAYKFLTDGVNKQLEEDAKNAARQERIAANGEKLLKGINDAVKAIKSNGFRRIG